MKRCQWSKGLAAMLLFAALFAWVPVMASDKYIIQKDKPFDDARKPAPGKALIYFVRSQIMGAAVKVKLYADGKFLGIVMSHTYIPYECDPGKHEFIAAAENAGFLEADLLPDKIYIVQVSIHMGALKARTHFETARLGSEALQEITKVKDKLHWITTTDEGIAWANEKDADFQKTIKKFRDKGEEFEEMKPGDGYDAPPWVK